MSSARRVFLFVISLWTLSWVYTWGTLQWRGSDSAGLYVSRGYVETVDLFARHGWIAYDPAQNRIRPTFAPESPMAEFYHNSFLQDDVAGFNGPEGEPDRGNPRIFRIENGVILAIDRNLHNVPMPFADQALWSGLLTFRPESPPRGELRGDQVVVELFGPTESLRLRDRLPELVLGRERSKPDVVQVVRDEAVNLSAVDGTFFGKVHLIGRSVLFNNRDASGRANAFVSGEPVPQGNRARIDTGDLLALGWVTSAGPRRYALLWNTSPAEAPIISSHRLVNGTWRRSPQDPTPPFAADLLMALDGAVRENRDQDLHVRPDRREFDLALTLDARLHSAVQEILERACRGYRGPNEPPFRAAVTVMDTLTGEILALASYPTKKDLDGPLTGTDAQQRLLLNHNFSRRPVGSAAKPLFAAAIVDSSPLLANLQIRGYSTTSIPRILGIRLSRPLEDHGVPGGPDDRIDFEEFIEKSSNKYGATLLSLATAVSEDGRTLLPPDGVSDLPDALGPPDEFYVAGMRYDRRPAVRLALERDSQGDVVAKSGKITTLEYEPHVERLRAFFGSETTRKRSDGLERPGGEGDDLVDSSVWLPLLGYLYPSRVPRNHTFYGVSPERENLAYNLIENYRTQYLSLILGGASSTWTPVRMAQSYARLVTGLKVRATLVRRILTQRGAIEPPRDAKFEPLGMDTAQRLRLANALSLVADREGTAKGLASVVAKYDSTLAVQGKALGFFSKTGSPRIVVTEPSTTARAVNALIAAGALKLGADDRIWYRDHGPADADIPEQSGTSTTFQALLANSSDMSLLNKYHVSARSVVRVCDTFNDSAPEDRGRLFEVTAGRLVRMLAGQREVLSTGAVFVFTIGIYDAKARISHPRTNRGIDVVHNLPERALTVAMSVESQGNSVEVAVPLARELLTGAIWDALAAKR